MSHHIELGAKESSVTMGSLKEKEPCNNKAQKEKKIFCVNEERKKLGFSALPEKEADLLLSPINL